MKNKIFKSIVKKNPKGNIIKLLNEKDDFTNIRGEVYISKIGKNKIKAWKKHIKANLNLFLIRGKVKFVIFGQRQLKTVPEQRSKSSRDVDNSDSS